MVPFAPIDHIHILTVLFDGIISAEDLPAFRAALAERVGLEHEWFHNHNNDPEAEHKLHYRYPLIQYKRQGNQPMLVAIGQGTHAARMFFEQLEWPLSLRGRVREMEVERLCLQKYPIGIVEEGITYALYDWQPLNQHNHQSYQELEGLMDIVGFLEPKLIAHILNFAKSIGWNISERIELQITEMYPNRVRHFKGFQPTLFNFAFTTNVLLPNHIGLGKGSSLGFGNIRKKHKRTTDVYRKADLRL